MYNTNKVLGGGRISAIGVMTTGGKEDAPIVENSVNLRICLVRVTTKSFSYSIYMYVEQSCSFIRDESRGRFWVYSECITSKKLK